MTAWYGDAGAVYVYSGIRNDPLPWSDALLALRARLERSHGVAFNSVLLNWYRSGRDAMGWHADDEPELGPEPLIASISLGATRRFDLRHRVTGEAVSVAVEHGSLVVMSGATQRCWKHRIPKEAGVSGERINLTYRLIGR